MSRNKKKRYVDALSFPCLIQPGSALFGLTAGKRKTQICPGKKKLIIELGCGYGEYTCGLASRFFDSIFVGVDIKGARLRVGARRSIQESLSHVFFLRTIIQHLDQHFAPGEVDDIWIVHPDPRPKGADKRRRLTSGRFVYLYHRLLTPGGTVRLKTDDHDFFLYSIQELGLGGFELCDATDDIDNSPLKNDHYGIETRYEKKFRDQGKKIHYGIRKKKKVF